MAFENRRTKFMDRFAKTFLVVFSILLAFGCSKDEQTEKAALKDQTSVSPVIARVAKNSISVSDLKDYLADRSVPSRASSSEQNVTGRLDELVLEEVLYQEALRLNLDQDPQIRRRIRQMLIQQLMDAYQKQMVWNRDISESELRKFYEQHRHEYNRPAQMRLADIFFAVPGDASPTEKAAQRKKAQHVLVEALNTENKRGGFGSLIRKYSDTPGKFSKGDTGFFDREGKPAGIDKYLAETAFNLERTGRIYRDVIETPDGYHIIMLIGRRSPNRRSLDAVRGELTQRIRRKAAEETRKTYIAGLKKASEIEINTQILADTIQEMKKSAHLEDRKSKDRKTPKTERETNPLPPKIDKNNTDPIKPPKLPGLG